MKVIKNNLNNVVIKQEKMIEPYPRDLICEGCGSELQYDESDLRIGAMGCLFVDCPLCGLDNMIEGNEHEIKLTYDNIEFPIHFFEFGTEISAKCCDTEHIRGYLRDAIEWFRENKDEYCYYVNVGDLYLAVYRYDGDEEYVVYVAKGYYHTIIPFEKEDYEEDYSN